jgi:hypothetical protein
MTDNADNTDPRIEYELLPGGIHAFTMKESSLQAVDTYYSRLEPIYKARTDTSKPLLMLMVTPKRSLPFNAMIQRGKELLVKYPNLGTICSATVSSNATEAKIADTFMRVLRLPGVRVRFFSKRDDAIKWLLEQT